MERILNSANWGRKSANDLDSSQREPRRKQIELLLTELTQLRVVPNDDSRFQLTLQLANSPESPHTSSSTPHLTRTTSSPATATSHSPGISSMTAGAGTTSTATLTIYLPPTFPEEEPKITIQPTVRHLWVDCTVTPCVVTGHERLMPGGWSTHANLGRIVKEIVANIQQTGVLVDDHGDTYGNNGTAAAVTNNYKNNGSGTNNNNIGYAEYSHKPPPPIPGNRSKSLSQFNNQSTTSPFPNANGSHKPNTVGGSTSASNFVNSSGTGESQSSHHTQIRPNVSGIYSTTVSPEARIVMELSAEQIEEYLESPIAFEHFFDQLEVVVNSRTLKREWWHGNDNVSRRNLQLEAEMADLQKSTSEGYQVAMQLRKTLEEKLQQQQDALWRFKPETLQSKLRSAAAESDELSESIAQSFLEGKLDHEGFIRQYRDLRKVYHLREMKNERIGPILRNHPSSASLSSSSGVSATSDGAGSILSVGAGKGTSLGLNSGQGSGGPISGGGGGSGSGKGSAGGTGSNGDPWVML